MVKFSRENFTICFIYCIFVVHYSVIFTFFMLLRVLLKNFLSFDDEVQFDMFPNPKRTLLSSHIYTDKAVPVLKQAAIFGQNGAGKSNLVKGIKFIKSFALQKDFIKSIDIDRYFFKLKPNNDLNPIYLAIEFEFENRYYFYEIEIGHKSVTKEALYETFPLEEKFELVFERRKSKVRYSESEPVDEVIGNATESLLSKNPQSSLMALNKDFPIITDVRIKNANKWLRGYLEIIGVKSVIPTLIEILHHDSKLMNFTKEMVLNLEVGVSNFVLSDEEYESWAQHNSRFLRHIPNNLEGVSAINLNENDSPRWYIEVEDGIRKVYQLIFDNIGKDGYIGKLDAASQSDGTLRALMLLPALYFASKIGKTIVVDEINYCLSPSMVKGLVGYFSKMPDTNGQLIFTTHDVQLLDEKEILRSDEVWFVDKKDGATFIYTHNDFKEHHSISMYKGYNEGRFGAIRFINL